VHDPLGEAPRRLSHRTSSHLSFPDDRAGPKRKVMEHQKIGHLGSGRRPTFGQQFDKRLGRWAVSSSRPMHEGHRLGIPEFRLSNAIVRSFMTAGTQGNQI
jgi:hypothetical protein